MKIIYLTLIIVISSKSPSSAQRDSNHDYYIGGYYTFLKDPIIMESSRDTVRLTHHYMNINLRYSINFKWRIGAEYIITFTSLEEIEDPFHTFGLNVDYDLLRAKRSKLHLRGGLSVSNLSFAGDFEPTKKTVINRVLGVSYEFRISQFIWIYAGYYNHFPLNKIEYKYGIAQPFLGLCIGI